jgi:hypothetical protein
MEIAGRKVPRSCPRGLTDSELHFLMGDRYGEFRQWMDGRTELLCKGSRYSPATGRQEPDGCAGNPHGRVTYTWDALRFLQVID